MVKSTSITLTDASRHYLEGLTDGERLADQAEMQRFVRWYGGDRSCSRLHGHEVANYAETLTRSVTDAGGRADTVRKFLAFALKAGYTSTNLGTHLRLRKMSSRSPKRPPVPVQEFQMSEAQKLALEDELAALKSQRPGILEDLQRAMSDKDFKENAPLDAARDRQGYVEGKIRELEAKLTQAVIVQDEGAISADIAGIGSTVHVLNLGSGAESSYTLVRPNDAEAATGRISFESPVGRALFEHKVGDEIEVAAPSGTLRFRIERLEA